MLETVLYFKLQLNDFISLLFEGGLTVPEYRPSNSYQSSAFQNSSESQSFGSYGNGQRSGSQSQVSYNNNNASIPRQVVEVDHAEVQTPERFTSKSGEFICRNSIANVGSLVLSP